MSSYALAYPVCGNTAMKLWRIVESLKRSSAMYSVFIAISVLAFCLSTKNRSLDVAMLVVLFTTLLCIMGLRSQYVGADSLQYYLSFIELNNRSLDAALATRYAAGYILFVRLVGLFTNSPYVFFFVSSFVTLSIYFLFLRKYSKNIFMSIIIFFCLNWTAFLVLTRQSLACCCLLIGVPFLLNGRRITFALFVLIAMQFHSSAVVGLAFIPLSQIELNLNKIIVFLVVALVISFCLSLLWKIIPMLGVVNLYASYAGKEQSLAGTSKLVDIIIKFLPAIVCITLGYLSNASERSRANNFWTSLCLISACIKIIAMNSIIFERLSEYFNIAYPLTVANFIFSDFFNQQTKRLSISVLFCIFCIALFTTVQIVRPNWMKITPYSPFWAPVNAYKLDSVRYFW